MGQQHSKVLFVDDELLASSVYVESLREADVEVVVCSDVDRAIQEARIETYDAFVLDVMMPPGDAFAAADTSDGLRTGIRLFEHIRHNQPMVPIVLFSNFATALLNEDPALQSGPTRPRILNRRDSLPHEFVEQLLDLLRTSGRPAPEFELPHSSGIVAVAFDFTNLLVHESREPGVLFKLTPRQFEEFVADLWHRLGYNVELTAQTRDGGRDIIAVGHKEVSLKFLIECKRYDRAYKVDVSHVRSLYGVKVHENASKAILATTSTFTTPARDFFDAHRWELEPRDYAGVMEWAKMVSKR